MLPLFYPCFLHLHMVKFTFWGGVQFYEFWRIQPGRRYARGRKQSQTGFVLKVQVDLSASRTPQLDLSSFNYTSRPCASPESSPLPPGQRHVKSICFVAPDSSTQAPHDMLVFKGIFLLLSSSPAFDPINPDTKRRGQWFQVLELLADRRAFPWKVSTCSGRRPVREGLHWGLRGLGLAVRVFAGCWPEGSLWRWQLPGFTECSSPKPHFPQRNDPQKIINKLSARILKFNFFHFSPFYYLTFVSCCVHASGLYNLPQILFGSR